MGTELTAIARGGAMEAARNGITTGSGATITDMAAGDDAVAGGGPGLPIHDTAP